MTILTAPGVYDGIPDAEYHSHPALSSTGARLLLQEGGPARFAWEREHPREPKACYDDGHGVHKLVLGAGPEIVDVPFASWSYKAAKQLRAQAHAEGKIPLLSDRHAEVKAMADAIKRNKTAASLLDPERSRCELTLRWQDPAYEIECRARLDVLTELRSGRLIVGDVKTTKSVSTRGIAKALADYGYPSQQEWYLDGVSATGLSDDAGFVFVFVEKTPPYLVRPIQIPWSAADYGRRRNARAKRIYAECMASGEWPGFPDDIPTIDMPAWAYAQEDDL